MRSKESVCYDRGLAASFSTAEGLRSACSELNKADLGSWEAFTPYPEECIQKSRTSGKGRSVSRYVLVGAVAAAIVGYAIFYYSSVVDYPYRIGGRPLHSWPAFLPLCFELAILGGALTAVSCALWGNGMPAWAHPVFFCEGFESVSGTKRFLWVSCASEAEFEATKAILMVAGADTIERKESES